ncbi:DUF2218 domain-containing protein [Rhizobium puerariae]|uniref:DUF2218 domain-containing protein n=1 Tax=Rhizobium puerariae TaxID=1585791 RepID=A0ABV6ACX8_9HYPH
MPEATAIVPTEHGSKYLQQLCKHFAHKIEVSYTETHGECTFACGKGILDADASGLTVVATAPDREQLEQTKSVIESHLVRFAFREELAPLPWRDAAAA